MSKKNTPKRNEHPSYWGILPANVRYDKDIPDKSKIIFTELAALTNKYGYCSASNSYFSKLYGVNPPAVSKWIKALAEKGYVRSEMIKENDQIIERRIYLSFDVLSQIEKPENNEEGSVSKEEIGMFAENENSISTEEGGVFPQRKGGISTEERGYFRDGKYNNTSNNNTSNNNTSINKRSAREEENENLNSKKEKKVESSAADDRKDDMTIFEFQEKVKSFENLRQDRIENRNQLFKLFLEFAKTKIFLDQWTTLCIGIGYVDPEIVLKEWVMGCNDYQQLRQFKINKIQGWIRIAKKNLSYLNPSNGKRNKINGRSVEKFDESYYEEGRRWEKEHGYVVIRSSELVSKGQDGRTA